MQELLLASRILRYEKDQLKFVCWKGEASENQPEFKDPELSFDRGVLGIGTEWIHLYRGLPPDRCDTSASALYMAWYKTIERYTDLAITMQHDMLPAIGG
jgi:hypothetical protein